MATNCSGEGEDRADCDSSKGVDNPIILTNETIKIDTSTPKEKCDEVTDVAFLQSSTEIGFTTTDNQSLTNDDSSEITPIISTESSGILLKPTSEPKKGFSNKTSPIADDLNSELFPLEISPKRRKEKQKQYKREEFDFSVSTKKQIGFTTPRPIRWALTLEKYLANSEPGTYSWHHKMNQKTKKYSESYIIIEYKSKTVGVHILYYTGILIVNGDYKEWIENDFLKIQETFKGEAQPDLGEVAEWSQQEIETIWSKYDELETAVSNHDDIMQKMMERAQAAELKLLEIQNCVELKRLEGEKCYDEKLAAFTQIILEECEKQLGVFNQGVSKKFIAIHNKIDSYNTSLRNQIKNYLPKEDKPNESQTTNELHEQISSLESSIQQKVNNFINYGAIHEADAKITKMDENIKSLEAQVTALQKDITDEIQKSETQAKQLNDNMSLLKIQIQKTVEITQPTTPIIQETVGITQPSEAEATRVNPEMKENEEKQNVEIIMCFDSNGKHIERKKLWKVNGSAFWRCGTLHTVSEQVSKSKISSSKFFLINVGCNDLDLKDHNQVFSEIVQLITQIQEKFKDVKIIFGEITPRNDDRDREVILLNNLLNNFAKNNEDIFVIQHSNLRDPSWSMYKDEKHIHDKKLGKYCANIIQTLKIAYNIKSKSELFSTDIQVKMPKKHEPHNRYDTRGSFNNQNNYRAASHAQFQESKNSPSTSNFLASTFDPWRTSHKGKVLEDRLHQLANYDPRNRIDAINLDQNSNREQDLVITKLQEAIQFLTNR